MKHRTHKVKISHILAACLLSVAHASAAFSQDTLSGTAQKKRLDAVVVANDRKPSAALSQTPVQVVDIEKLERSGALLLSDAVRQMAGVTLRDYGGVGGMKTVSARGLGSQFSTLAIDGVAVSDCQNGQVDMGRYTVANTAFISLSNGQQDNMLLSARAAAAGNVINMETREPSFMPGEKNHLRLSMEAGSFALLSPTLAWDCRLGSKASMSFMGNWLQSDGNYPFTLYYTTSHNDSSSVERREHSAMKMATGDLNLFYNIAAGRTLTAKAHFVQGFHELPGPVTFYSVKGSEETRERLFFTQAKYTSTHKNTDFQVIGKYQYSYDLYEDYQASSLSGYLMNEYAQNEGYLSATTVWRPCKGLSTALATDAAVTTLASSLSRNSHVRRLASLTSLSVQYRMPRLTAKGSLLATVTDEVASDVSDVIPYRKLSPYIGLSVKPFRHNNIRIRYFFKETYRIPNFNEMYYFTMPLSSLKPECASQHNIGVTMPLSQHYSADSAWRTLISMTVDAYHNSVKDKIIAVPRQNMFIWSTMNLGLVKINGLDVKGSVTVNRHDAELEVTATYSYQQAQDYTNPDNPKTYRHQIPYTPLHSGGITLYHKNPWFNAGYSCMAVGKRYSQRQNSDNSLMQPYADHGVSVDRTFHLPAADLFVQLQVLNIFDKQYEVVRSYPMMGRNFRIKIMYSF